MAGPDASSAERKPSATVWMENLTKIAAILGAFVAVGQAGSEAIRGYWQRETDRAKAAQELALTRLKESSKLAQDYIQLLMNKDVAPADRIMLLGALSEIKDHPLQKWAQDRHASITRNLDAISKAREAQIQAAEEKDEKERRARILMAEIAELNEEAKLARENVVESGKIKVKVKEKSEELAKVHGERGLAVAKLETSITVVARTESGGSVAASDVQDKAREITRLIEKIDTRMLLTVFPASAESNINKYLPFVKAAIQEFQISDRRIVAAILATIRVDAPDFEPISNPNSVAQFRSRGFIGLTGAPNYAQVSTRLGLGTRLVDYPDEANSPEVAARVLCAYFVDAAAGNRLRQALDSGDPRAIYSYVARGPTPSRFVEPYEKLLAQL
jgi:hypothetical protein